MSYYTDYSNCTDWHEVDEDVRSVIIQGGCWSFKDQVGITERHVSDPPIITSILLDIVASRCCTIQKNKHHSPSLEGE